MSANDPAATDTAAIIQGLRDELQNFENIRLQNERQNEENLNSVSIFFQISCFIFNSSYFSSWWALLLCLCNVDSVFLKLEVSDQRMWQIFSSKTYWIYVSSSYGMSHTVQDQVITRLLNDFFSRSRIHLLGFWLGICLRRWWIEPSFQIHWRERHGLPRISEILTKMIIFL